MSTNPSTNDGAGAWHDACADAAIPEGEVIGVRVGERDVALARFEDRCYAFDTWCTHGHANLADGFVEGDGSIECPLHQGRFDVRTGRALCEPVETDLQTFETKVDAGRVWIRLQPG